MTTGVGATGQAKSTEFSRSKKGAKAEHEQAFEAALVAQWSQGAQLSRAPTTPGVGASAGASKRYGTESPGSIVSAGHRDAGARRRAGAYATTGDKLTQLASQELAGRLPSRKEAFRAAEDERAAGEPLERAAAPGTRARARAAIGKEEATVARPLGELTPNPDQGRRGETAARSDARAVGSEGHRGWKAERSPEPTVTKVDAGRPQPLGHGTREPVTSRAALLQPPAKASSAVAGIGLGAASRRATASGNPSAAAPPRRNPPPELESPIASQTLRGLAAALRQGNGSVTLHLAPENLGPLRLGISVKASEVVARVEATTEEAARAIREHTSALREALEAQGFAVTRIDIEHVSPALLHLRESARDGQNSTTPQWGGESPADGRRHSSEGGGREPGSKEHDSSGTRIAEQARAAANIVGADGVNAIV
jgi:hypothetical protein